ncbi:hypothetical protein [Candidatus Bathycorpusculum sp.]|uniref:hypothetical protein n=1 Tax=Candidatus Bathycorpusculum sp. TaxID=2994959 RepID=UPI00281ED885|nr:hypothetical protein [Candidatus Termitimicrobium sp.]MCL2685538.1 hypothetical protein [Candidatus Termitimicrobium sp.]
MQKTKTFLAMILLAALLVPTVLQLVSIVSAENPKIPIYLEVHAEPNPVGVGQDLYLSLFSTKPIPGTFKDMSIVLVHPDGKNETFGPYDSDTTGGVGGIVFVPKVEGNYTAQAFYKGQTIRVSGVDYDIQPAMSKAVNFTVQTEPVIGNPLAPLPTEYWSRPIYSTNFAWSKLGGNWYGLGCPSFADTGGYDGSGNNFNPYSQAPNTGHIMWVKPTAFGGQVGGPISGDQERQYTSTSILYRQFEPIILNGIIYYKLYPNTPTTYSSAGGTPGWDAVDLRTGELVWHKDTSETLIFGWNMQFHTVQEYGTQAYLVAAASSSLWKLYDPMTGYFIANITGVASQFSDTTTTRGLIETDEDSSQGAVYMYYINGTYPNLYLNMWNSTRCLAPNSASTIRPVNNIPYNRGVQWTVRLPENITINGVTTNITQLNDPKKPALSIAARTNEVIVLRSHGQELPMFTDQFGTEYSIELGISAKNGTLLWGPVKRDTQQYNEVTVVAAGDGYYVTHDKDLNIAYVYNINNGRQIGKGIPLEGNSLSTLSRGGAIAYDKCYIWDFGGYVNAIDLATATVNWTIAPRSAGYDTPYGIYPYWHFGSHSIADGKLFLSEGRMYDPPLFTNAHKMAINITDGSIVWSVLGTYAREPSAIADGYMVGWNSYDAQIYTFGKGPSQTTVSTSTGVVPFGSSVILTGTVLDISAGTRDADRSARFPNGVAAVSDESQSAWMEYVYMQQLMPNNITGVTVELSVLDSNNNYRPIGTTTADETGFFSYNWKPDIEGKFTVYARFSGSESYWPSTARTAFAVDEVAPTQAPTETPGPGIADTYFLPAVAAIIIAIVIIGALIMLMLRKRP